MPSRRLLLLCAVLATACTAPAPTPSAEPSYPSPAVASSTPIPQGTLEPGATVPRRYDPHVDPTPTPSPTPTPTPRPTPRPTPKPTPRPTERPAPRLTAAPRTTTVYAGTSRFWYPDAGISTGWRWYGCAKDDPSTLPGGLWRWRCNPDTVYLLSHAWSTFAALRTAYHAGRVNVGDSAWFANEAGVTSRYTVRWVKRVDTTYFDSHNGEFLGGPGKMTLQTCDGANNEWRLVVRLVG